MDGTAVLSDQTTVTYADATEFIDFYCAKFRFSKPVVATELRSTSSSTWDSLMTIEGRKVGMGSAKSKKGSQHKCTLDVVRYLEQCDPGLWTEFVHKRKIGEGLGDAPPIPFFIPSSICTDVRDLCVDLHHSQLYTANAAATLIPPTPVIPQPTSEYFNHQQKSQFLLDRHQSYLEDPRMEKMRATRMELPVNARRQDILDLVAENDVSVFMAATGSGKTTQIPQMILDAWTEEGKGALCNIVCTQPRRLAALGVATRVAAERGEQVGQSVGYAVRFDSRPPQPNGSITFLTIGVFLKQLQAAFVDPRGPISLDHITHILVDEVHERDVDTDILLVVLKRFLADRKARRVPIKIVLMSATIDATLFQNYFPDNGQPAPVAEIPGRSFPVDKLFLESIITSLAKSVDSWALRDPSTQRFLLNEQQQSTSPLASTEPEIPFLLIAATVSHVLNSSDDGHVDGHVLVFLPGWEEINKVDKLLKGSKWAVDFNDSSRYEIHVLHSTVPLEAQQAVFSPPTPGVRRVILTTNIAETSVTIPDVVYVVDSARLKENRFDPNRHLTSLVTSWVGRSNLNQRAGRAGRHRHGFYYGILSEARANALSVYQTVEMARTDLTDVVMRVKAMNFTDMSVHDVLGACIEPPESSRIVAALNHLSACGALDDKENLTALGRILLQLPLDVHLGRLVLYGAFFRCLDQAVTLAAIMANRDPWLSPPQRRKEAKLAKESWAPAHYQSDPIATLRAFNSWNEQFNSTRRYQEGYTFLMNNFLSRMTFLTIDKTRSQILRALGDAGILNLADDSKSESGVNMPRELNANAGSYPALMSLIAVASMPKFAICLGGVLYRTKQDNKAIVHRSSVNGEKRTLFSTVLSFLEKRNNIADGSGVSQTSLCNTTSLDILTYVLFGSHKQEIGDTVVRCDDWLVLTRYDRNNEAVDVLRLRQYLDRAMLRFFAGLALGAKKRPVRRRSADEQEALDDPGVVQPLTRTELRELSLLSRDVVRILEKYSKEKITYNSMR
ncbi:P-loop containing nucleoside triphosphate hydrolase protein [Hymenopellis radicata]|nr:P-loop containing nucleoside triphosphate hydrolase protein [Hymenopellis radicata]